MFAGGGKQISEQSQSILTIQMLLSWVESGSGDEDLHVLKSAQPNPFDMNSRAWGIRRGHPLFLLDFQCSSESWVAPPSIYAMQVQMRIRWQDVMPW